MSERLRSVGLDVGTTTTQLILSQLTVENKASSFAVPQMEITQRQILYKSPVHFTPLLDDRHVDGPAIARLVADAYRDAGIKRESVDTGAIIITGETSRKENAKAVLDSLSEFAGEFVVATAGPDLESILAAKGAGAVERSQQLDMPVLHMDIGGGTSNLALIRDGSILQTGCLNVGGRLLKFDETGTIVYRSPVLEGICQLQVGQRPNAAQIADLARTLTQALEMAAGLRQKTNLLEKLLTKETAVLWEIPKEPVTLSFSGGVADCISSSHPPLAFGDMGPALGQAIAESSLCRGTYFLGRETIRATVIGAGCHSAQLSGSTVFHRGIRLPVKNLPVAVFSRQEQQSAELPQRIARQLRASDSPMTVLAFPGPPGPDYSAVTAFADAIVRGTAGAPVLVCLEADMAKALGHALCLRLDPETPCLCIDRVQLQQSSYLDIGAPVGPALPVVIKTLVLSQN